jgi:hypothetical protein
MKPSRGIRPVSILPEVLCKSLTKSFSQQLKITHGSHLARHVFTPLAQTGR